VLGGGVPFPPGGRGAVSIIALGISGALSRAPSASPEEHTPPRANSLGLTSFSHCLYLLLLLFPCFNDVSRLLLHFLFSNAKAELNI